MYVTVIFLHTFHNNAKNILFTVDYPYAGQNIAMVSHSASYHNLEDAIRKMFNEWFNEYVDCDVSTVKSYTGGNGPQIGHFTQIANNKANHLGCAIVKFNSGGYKTYLVCNYSLINMENEPIFTIGKACSKCEAGKSARFPGLCHASESDKIEPLPQALSKSQTTKTSSKSTSTSVNGNTVSSSSSSSSSSAGKAPAPAPRKTYTTYDPYASSGGFNWGGSWNF